VVSLIETPKTGYNYLMKRLLKVLLLIPSELEGGGKHASIARCKGGVFSQERGSSHRELLSGMHPHLQCVRARLETSDYRGRLPRN
jgi:hypothetical protein